MGIDFHSPCAERCFFIHWLIFLTERSKPRSGRPLVSGRAGARAPSGGSARRQPRPLLLPQLRPSVSARGARAWLSRGPGGAAFPCPFAGRGVAVRAVAPRRVRALRSPVAERLPGQPCLSLAGGAGGLPGALWLPPDARPAFGPLPRQPPRQTPGTQSTRRTPPPEMGPPKPC